MARTPLPSGTVFKSLILSVDNHAHLERVAAGLHRTPSDALNAELDWLRTWGVGKSRVRRLRAAAEERKRSVQEFVREVIHDAALQLPAAKRAPARRSEEVHRTTMSISGPNAALIAATALETRDGFNGALNRLLEFAQAYDLHPDLLAAVDQAAEEVGDSRRDVVQRIIAAAAEALPDVPEPRRRTK